LKENFELQKENGILIKEFIDDLNDTELLDIMVDLIEIAERNVEDIRKHLFKLNKKRNILE
jgi:TFIIF-interacting CTD phosphatase-like protein